MKILLLGPYREKIIEFIKSFNDEVIHQENKIDEQKIIKESFDFIISYGYRYLIPKSVVDCYEGKMINLHISFLPWNRGADPNLWSFLEDTPKGVTIHYIDEGLDKGDIIAQKEIRFLGEETLSTSYKKLTSEIECLFKESWLNIRIGKNSRQAQKGKGSYHSLKDKEKFMRLLIDDWDTKVSKLKQVRVR